MQKLDNKNKNIEEKFLENIQNNQFLNVNNSFLE